MKSQSYIPSWTLIGLATAVAGYTIWSRVPKSKKETQDDDDEPANIPLTVPQQIDISQHKSADLCRIQTQNTITIAYASTTGTCKSFATSMYETLKPLVHNSTTKTRLQICTVDELDWWDELLNKENETGSNPILSSEKLPPMVIFVLPTWTGGTLPEQYSTLLTSLHEICHDWRVAPKPLRSGDDNEGPSKRSSHKNDLETLQIASFGMGSTAYDKTTFCKPAKDVFKYFMKLGARSLLVSHGISVVGMGDDDAGDCKAEFQDWMNRVVKRLEEMAVVSPVSELQQKKTECCKTSATGDDKSCACQEEKNDMDDNAGCCSNGADDDSEGFNSDDDEDDYSDDDDDDDDDEEERKEPDVMDLEDLGNAMKPESTKSKVLKEMVTPKQAAALKKEGYRIVGTHSAVKLCRWTKHQLRGRGGCYKHTFYGITSYQCMEATPSLACANKCTFTLHTSTVS
jgi:tRNA wybutosine-synthesizing protein 1